MNLKNIEVILFDFDGVILDSMPVRDFGFREIFKHYDKKLIDKLIEYHRLNGGLSRFIKIRYFYEELLQEKINEKKVQEYAKEFSIIMRQELSKKKYLIDETIQFIKYASSQYKLFIVSGSEHEELNFLCKELEINHYFDAIYGSPTLKEILIQNIITTRKFDYTKLIMIGDAINDYEAAKKNKVKFYGYNNINLKKFSYYYIYSFNKQNK